MYGMQCGDSTRVYSVKPLDSSFMGLHNKITKMCYDELLSSYIAVEHLEFSFSCSYVCVSTPYQIIWASFLSIW